MKPWICNGRIGLYTISPLPAGFHTKYIHMQEFFMTEEEYQQILDISRRPHMKVGVWLDENQQEDANAFWRRLGTKYGFDPNEVTAGKSGKLSFMARLIVQA